MHLLLSPLVHLGFLHVRSFSTSGSTTTALWVNQELADHGSDCISSVLKLKRVEPHAHESAKTPEARRVRKCQASSSVEVEGLGSLIPGYHSDSMYTSTSSSSVCPVPKLVHFQHGEPNSPTISKTMVSCEVTVPVSPPNIQCASVSQGKSNDPLIGIAAELLLSLSNSAAWAHLFTFHFVFLDKPCNSYFGINISLSSVSMLVTRSHEHIILWYETACKWEITNSLIIMLLTTNIEDLLPT